jgi:cell division protein FtsW (lipid II flippase)
MQPKSRLKSAMDASMKARWIAALVLIAIPFATSIPMSVWIISSAEELAAVGDGAQCRYHIRENGYSRLSIALVGLTVLFMPFRRRERWAWLAMLFIFALYILPVYVLVWPSISWETLKIGAMERNWLSWGSPGLSVSLAELQFNSILTAFMIACGLFLAIPEVVRKRPPS